MNIGVIFPQTEFGNDPIAIRDYAQTAEELGFTHIVAYDHVLGANPNRPGGWNGPYTYQSAFQEPFVLFSFMAGVTQKIGFVPGVIILPQRQTALVAKQAATLDVLSGGRLRLGVGIGWNAVEYIALNENFHNRGRRLEEQVEVLRQLWTQPLVNFSGQWHTIPDAGSQPATGAAPYSYLVRWSRRCGTKAHGPPGRWLAGQLPPGKSQAGPGKAGWLPERSRTQLAPTLGLKPASPTATATQPPGRL